MSEERWLFYMAPKENAGFIVHLGVYPYNKVKADPELRTRHRSIADRSVNSLRDGLLPDDRSVHDYVPLYWATHTPMQYVVTQKEQRIREDDLVFFLFSPDSIFGLPGVLSSDGNVAHGETTVYRGRGAEPHLDWKILGEHDCYSREYKRKKAAEVLVPDHVPPELIARVVVRSEEALAGLRKEIEYASQTLSLTVAHQPEISVCWKYYYSSPLRFDWFRTP